MTTEQLRQLTKALYGDTSAVTAIEYALLAALIFAVIVTSVALLGDVVGTLYDDVADKVAAAMP